MTHIKDGIGWDFAFEYMPHMIEPLELCNEEIQKEVDR